MTVGVENFAGRKDDLWLHTQLIIVSTFVLRRRLDVASASRFFYVPYTAGLIHADFS